ncbi:hypothetical protein B0O99DRAFT_624698 [Bisporella sp. PMI_857]|nr:hypothetical protein B0O99DRAFT_624698 [Bisporella sp. PMI_857]
MADPTETSPLLTVIEPRVDEEASNTEAGAAPLQEADVVYARDYFKRPIRSLTISVLTASIINTVIATGAYFFLEYKSLGGYMWQLEEAFFQIGACMFCTGLLALINLNNRFPIGLNAVADLYIALLVMPIALDMLDRLFPTASDLCPGYRQMSNCRSVLLTDQILTAIGGGIAIAVAVTHGAFFVLRIIACHKSNFWGRLSGSSFPNGEVTLAVTFRISGPRQQPAIAENVSPSGPLIEAARS